MKNPKFLKLNKSFLRMLREQSYKIEVLANNVKKLKVNYIEKESEITKWIEFLDIKTCE